MAAPKTIPPIGGFYFDNDGVFAIEQRLVPVMGLDDMIKDAASKQAVPLKRIHDGDETNLGGYNALVWGDGAWAIGCLLDRLTFKTDYKIIDAGGNKWLAPTFLNYSDVSFPLNWTWVSTGLVRYAFLLVIHHAARGDNDSVLLGIYDYELKKLYQPPFGNVYSDQRVCMGNSGFYTDAGLSLVDNFQRALQLINDCPWNGDLVTEYTRDVGSHFIRFSVETEGLSLEPLVGDNQWQLADNVILCNYYEQFLKPRS